MYKYQGIIFDLDGTLLDTIEDISDSVNEVLDNYGFPNHGYDDYKLKIGNGFKNLLEKSLPEDTDIDINEALTLFIEAYSRRYQNKTKPYNGIIDLLDKLNQIGIKLGINSNKRNDYTNQLANKFFKDIPFIQILGERKGVPKKPNPASALEIASLMGLDPKEILYIGDSKTDLLTAKNADMHSVGVLWGFRSYDELAMYNATYIVNSPQEIVDII